jgi:hypothetical protein
MLHIYAALAEKERRMISERTRAGLAAAIVDHHVAAPSAATNSRRRKQMLICPEPWARKLRDQRHIGDFRRWQDHNAYQQSFQRMLRDLMKEQPAPPRPP